MKKTERIIIFILLFVIGLSNLATPVTYAAETVSASSPHLSSQKPQIIPASRPSFHKPDSGSVLGASTSLFEIGTQTSGEAQGTIGSANRSVPIRMQQLAKKVYETDESVTLAVTNPSNDPFTTSVVDAKGQVLPVPISESNDGTTTDVQIAGSNEIKPGRYTIKVADNQGNVTAQDFSWGVLALNTDKSMYHPGETANISMGVLDDKGSMVCDASLTLKITNQAGGAHDTLSTGEASASAQTITVNPQCQKHDFSLQPDYQAHYTFAKKGTYTLQLSAITSGGTHTITNTVSVIDQIPFDVQRVSATRIYPPNTYPMTINITAHKDFSGVVTETVPQDFTITPATESATTVNSYTNMQTMYLDEENPAVALQQAINASSSGGLVIPFHGNFPITQGFGAQLTDPTLQAFYTHYGLAGHDGIDFGVPMNTPLYAVDDGNIIWSGPGDYGTTIIIQHGWGESYYGHLSTTAVTVGTHVTKGQLIGYSGESGEATGPHLHFGMKPLNPDMTNGYYGKVDPMPYLPYNNQQAQSLATLDPNLGQHVLSSSTSADTDSDAGTVTPTTTPAVSPAISPSATPSAQPTIIPSPTGTNQQTTITETPTPPDNTNFTVLNKQILLSEQLANNSETEKVKVLTWNVKLKKGETTSLGYDYQAPHQSPQFYLMGPIQFYQSGSNKVVFQEQRQWQIASDDVGVDWYVNTSGNPFNGYNWLNRKKLDISLNNVYATPSAQTATFMDSGTDATQDTSFYTGTSFSTGTGATSSDCTTSETGPCSIQLNAGTGSTLLDTGNTAFTSTAGRVSFYFKTSALPTGVNVLHMFNIYTGAAFDTAPVEIVSANTLACGDGTGGSTTLSTNTWYRASIGYVVTGTNITYKMYLNGKLELTCTNNSLSGHTAPNNMGFGSDVTGTIVHIDDVYADTGTDSSDTGDVHVTAKRPFSNGAANGFATQINVSDPGSGYGSGHAPQVNERPINVNAGWQTNANATTEEYTIEGASTGDVNIPANAGLIGDQAWIYLISTATCTTGNAKIINNGVSTNITLPTAANTMLTNYASTTTFPSGNTAVGMSTCTTGAPTVKLFEAGVQVAYIPDLNNFPVLVNLSSDNDLKGVNTQSSGADILFTDSTGRNLLPFEIESYNNTTGALQAWVNTSSLSTATDTIIYMYYHNPAATTLANTSGTWGSVYGGVWHFSNIAGTGLGLNDSSGNSNTLTNVGTVTAIAGQISEAARFNGSNDFTAVNNSIFSPTNTPFSVYVWINTTNSTGEPVMDHQNGTGVGWELYVGNSGAGTCTSNGSVCFSDGPNDWGAAAGFATNTWTQVAVVKTGTTANFYANGLPIGSSTVTGTLTAVATTEKIGADTGSNYDNNMDELEYTNTPLSPGWVRTEFSNQKTPGGFYSLGNVETSIYAPSMDELMAHGDWFNHAGTKQPFAF